MSQSYHDFEELARRWENLAAGLPGVELSQMTMADGFPVYALETTGNPGPACYLSAGVHGDECAPVWALLHWAEANRDVLAKDPFLIFPCLNPHGFINNIRIDGSGIDLNRGFQNRSIPVISAWQEKVSQKKFRQVLNLHEDYDSRGIYLYEIAKNPYLGRKILNDCSSIIACDPDPEIDGQRFENGLCFHPGENIREVVENDLEGGFPEAIYLYLFHTETALTFETPSEMGITDRIAAQKRAIESFVAG
ncbi:MAG: M14 family metallocarboxypeptidase [Verrucomicrobiales bacterium]|nr:M14 family metallocarboxypeptidase [Verrucomicrobiales bacterium]